MLKFIDLFSGTGGIRLGFEQACKEFGLRTKCVFSSEIDKNAAQSYKLNFNENSLNDITTVSADLLPDFDFLLAGFPCQAFSYAGKQKGFGDTRGTLFFDVERILKAKQPKYFLLENVRGLTTHDNGRTFQVIKDSLETLGYSIEYRLLNSSNFDVPQNRVRLYILGKLDGKVHLDTHSDLGAADTHKYKEEKGLLSLFEEKKGKSVADILLDFAEVDPKYLCSQKFRNQLRSVVGDDLSVLNGYRLIDYRGGKSLHSWELGIKGECSKEEVNFMNALIANRRKKTFGVHQDGKSLTQKQIETFFETERFDEITESLIEKGYLKKNDGKYNPVAGNMSFEVFKFLDSDGISITLTASDCNRLGVVQNNYPRRLTPRECARLQGYPDSYKLIDNDNATYKQMGNGVSVPVVKAIALDFLKHNL